MRMKRTVIVALILAALLVPMSVQAKSAEAAPGSVEGVTCNLPESDAEALVILSNYYPNRGLKVFKKPKAAVLAKIINYRDPLTRTQGPLPEMEIGHVRYASTNRPFQKIGDAPVLIAPTDLLG